VNRFEEHGHHGAEEERHGKGAHHLVEEERE
jgi:hypothetical protein